MALPTDTMRVQRLNHVNIRTDAVARTVAFYEEVLGLQATPGASSSNGRQENVWLLDDSGAPLIHVNGPAPGETVEPAGRRGRLDHFALDCLGLDACVSRLRAAAVPFERLRIEARGLTQLNVIDPNGLKVELTFGDPADV